MEPRRPFRDMPIKQKLMVIIMVTTAAALVITGTGIVASDSILFRGYLERDLSALASIIADNSTAALAFDDPKAASETLAALRARTHIETACIYRDDGTTLARYYRPNDTAACPPPTPGSRIQNTGSDLVVTRPVMLKGRQIGTLVLLYDLGEIYERMRLYAVTVLIVLLGSSLIAFILSSRLRAVIATPVSQLAEAATRVSRTRDFSVRANKYSNDELGSLVDSFNEMLQQIQTRDSELRLALDSRQQALDAAQAARDSLRTTLASIGDAVISTDVAGRIVFANRVAQALLRMPEADLIGRPFDEVFRIVHEVSRDPIASPVSRILHEDAGIGISNDSVLIARDQTEIPIEHSGAPIRSDGGVIQGTVLVFRDDTARRRAEETSRLLASIVESSDDAIIGKNLDGSITSWNHGAERIFGYTAQEMIGRSISILAPSAEIDEMPAVLERIRKGERIDQYHALKRTKSGDSIHVSIIVSPLRGAFGQVVGASTVARDITEQVRAANQLGQLNADLRKSNESLARSNQDLERFAFVASHDLQEPLRMITVYSQLLVRTYPAELAQLAESYIVNIVDGAKRMRDLLTDLLAYTEIGAADESPQTGPVDLNMVLHTAITNLHAAILESGAEVTCGHLPSVYVQEGHFVSLFQNLIGNAIKYRSEKVPHIHIGSEQVNGDMRFSVSDNGIGIAPEYHQKIFGAFKRLHGKKIPGTGIGLAICQRVVERYGGRIWVESQAGQGATFRFTLPVSLSAEKRVGND